MNKNNSECFTLPFPEAKGLVISSDVHGDFNQLFFKLCVQYQLKDTLLIVAGDCGFDFEKRESYENMVKRNAKRMNEANNWIMFVRGNHDNPACFGSHTFKHKRFIAVPDYAIIQACSHTILCVGGAISVDRQCRMWKGKRKYLATGEVTIDDLARNVYWKNEVPLYDEKKMEAICLQFTIDTVITHTAPSFCELFTKGGLHHWMQNDDTLLGDVEAERATMNRLHERLVRDRHPASHWFYGHFQQSWYSSIDGILFQMLDLMEFCPVY